MILVIRCHRESFIALNRTALLFPLSRRAKSDGISTADLKKYGNVYRVATKIPNPIDLIPKETQIHLRSAKISAHIVNGFPFPLKLEAVFRCPTPDLYERYLHIKFKSRRIQGEQFDLTEEDKDEMDRVMEELNHIGNFTGDTRLLDKLKLKKKREMS